QDPCQHHGVGATGNRHQEGRGLQMTGVLAQAAEHLLLDVLGEIHDRSLGRLSRTAIVAGLFPRAAQDDSRVSFFQIPADSAAVVFPFPFPLSFPTRLPESSKSWPSGLPSMVSAASGGWCFASCRSVRASMWWPSTTWRTPGAWPTCSS